MKLFNFTMLLYMKNTVKTTTPLSLSRLPKVLYSYGIGTPGGYYLGSYTLPVNTVIKFVPQQQAWIVERFGKFSRILDPGLAILFPFIDQIKYVKTLKEVAVEIPTQSAITQGIQRVD